MSVNPVISFKSSENNTQKHLKRRVLVTSAMGTAAAFGLIAHKQGFRISNLKKVAMKDWALFKITPKSLKIEEKEILAQYDANRVSPLIKQSEYIYELHLTILEYPFDLYVTKTPIKIE